jgi:hypothetical protein
MPARQDRGDAIRSVGSMDTSARSKHLDVGEDHLLSILESLAGNDVTLEADIKHT